MLNSYIIYKMHIEETVMPRLRFMLSIIDELVSKYDPLRVSIRYRRRRREETEERQREPLAILTPNNIDPQAEHRLEKLPKKKNLEIALQVMTVVCDPTVYASSVMLACV